MLIKADRTPEIVWLPKSPIRDSWLQKGSKLKKVFFIIHERDFIMYMYFDMNVYPLTDPDK